MSIAHFSYLCFGKDVWAKHHLCLINSRDCLHPLENHLFAKCDCLYIHSMCSQPCGLLRQLHNVTYSNYLVSAKKRHNIFIVPWVFSTDIMSLTPREKFASLCQFFNLWYLPEFMYLVTRIFTLIVCVFRHCIKPWGYTGEQDMAYVLRKFLTDLGIYSRKQAVSLDYSKYKNRLNIKELQMRKG